MTIGQKSIKEGAGKVIIIYGENIKKIDLLKVYCFFRYSKLNSTGTKEGYKMLPTSGKKFTFRPAFSDIRAFTFLHILNLNINY